MGLTWITIVCVASIFTVEVLSLRFALPGKKNPGKEKPGICPVNTNPDVGCIPEIEHECSSDRSCPGKQKCCIQGCFRVCQNPVTVRPHYRPKRQFCPTCCGPPPCCSSCITCDPGYTFTGKFCRVKGSRCRFGQRCTTSPDAGSHGICCAKRYPG